MLSGFNKGKRVSRRAKLAALVLFAGVEVGVTSLVWEPRADQAENARPTKSEASPGTFRPTQQQWRGLKLEPVTARAFFPEQVTDETIAIDDISRITPAGSSK
jgi:hypothetical protein